MLFRSGFEMPEWLRRAGFRRGDWFRIKGGMPPGEFEDALKAVSPEYRELVRSYFLELARENENK